jgi:hypothetical protein
VGDAAIRRESARDGAKLGQDAVHDPCRPSTALPGAGAVANPVQLVDDGLDQRLMDVRRIGDGEGFHRVAP